MLLMSKCIIDEKGQNIEQIILPSCLTVGQNLSDGYI